MKFEWSLMRPLLRKLAARFRLGDQSKTRSGMARESPSSIPATSHEAHTRLHDILEQKGTIKALNHEEFMLGWIAIAYIAPGLDPDEAAIEDGGWPEGWRPVAAEAFRRFGKKELTREELYPRPVSFL
jgi:hypothetical protein